MDAEQERACAFGARLLGHVLELKLPPEVEEYVKRMRGALLAGDTRAAATYANAATAAYYTANPAAAATTAAYYTANPAATATSYANPANAAYAISYAKQAGVPADRADALYALFYK